MEPIKILFVCESCIDRSKTFEKYFNKTLQENGNIEVKSKGTKSYYDYDLLKQEDIDWADEIFFMTYSEYMFVDNSTFIKDYNKFNIIGVSNDYSFGDKKLLEIVKDFQYKWLKKKNDMICNNCSNITYYNDCVEISFGYPSKFDGETYKFCSDKCLKHWVSNNIKDNF